MYLIRNRNRVVSRQELLEQLWSGVHVGEESLTRAIRLIRVALDDTVGAPRYVETLRGRGYHFIADCAEIGQGDAPTAGAEGPRLLARDDTLAAFDEAWGGVSQRGRMLFLRGEPGIGKTALINCVTERTRSRGGRVVRGWCHPEAIDTPFWPWTRILTLLADSGIGDGVLEETQREEHGDSLLERFERFLRVIRGSSEAGPLLITIDDLQWADASSLKHLELLAHEIDRLPLVVVLAARSGGLDPGEAFETCQSELRRVEAVSEATLRGLEEPEIAELLTDLTGASPPGWLPREIHARWQGNPLSCEEVARLFEREAPVTRADIERLTPASVGANAAALLRRRLDALDSATRSVLEAGAVVGRDFDQTILVRIVEAPIDLHSALDAAIRARLIVRVDRGIGRLRFEHDLVRELLYDGIEADRRMRLHEAVGVTLENIDGEGANAARLAMHFSRAAPLCGLDKAIRYADLAASQAEQEQAYETVAVHLERAVDALVLSGDEDRHRRGELLLRLGRAHGRAGDIARARVAIQWAADLATELGDEGLLVEAALSSGRRPISFDFSVPWPDDAALIEAAMATSRAEDPGTRALLQARLMLTSYWGSGADTADAFATRAIEDARKVDRPEVLAKVLLSRCMALMRFGSGASGFEVANAAIEQARACAEPAYGFLAHGMGIGFMLQTGRIPEAEASTRAMYEAAGQLRDPAALWIATIARATLARVLGGSEVADTLFAAMQDEWRSVRDPVNQIARMLGHVHVLHERGLNARAQEELAPHRPLLMLHPVGRLLSEFLDASSDDDAVRKSIGTVLEALSLDSSELWAPEGLALASRLTARISDVALAEKLYALLAGFSDEWLAMGLVTCHGPKTTFLGMLAAIGGRYPDLAEQHLRASIETCRQAGAQGCQADALLELGRVLVLSGGAPDITKLALDEAIALASAWGLRRIHGEARTLLQSLDSRC